MEVNGEVNANAKQSQDQKAMIGDQRSIATIAWIGAMAPIHATRLASTASSLE
jgi:hypothetical protein